MMQLLRNDKQWPVGWFLEGLLQQSQVSGGSFRTRLGGVVLLTVS